MLLLDSDILVDILRGHPRALAWSAAAGKQLIAITVFSEFELLAGCRDQSAQNLVEKLIARCHVFYPTSNAMRQAVAVYKNLHLVQGIGANDALIAQTAVELGLPLHTFNLKHYRSVPALVTIQPYTR